MSIEPDTKNWTWVLERDCPDCGFAAATFPPSEVGRALRENGAVWRDLLRHPSVRRRPHAGQWSALEYACHVRDVFRLYDERLRLMLETDDPTFANWDQDVTAVEQRYGEQEPDTVAVDLVRAAGALADRFDSVAGDQWQRTGTRSDGARFTIDSFSRYLLHDPVHHVWDVESGNRSLSST